MTDREYPFAVGADSPKIREARDIARGHGADVAIVFLLSDKRETLEYASYGRTAWECKRARLLAEEAFGAMMALLSS